jgi:hypothetical protein
MTTPTTAAVSLHSKITAIVIEMVSTPAMNNALVKVGDREGHHHQRRAQSAIERRAGKRPSRAEAASVVLCVDGSGLHTATSTRVESPRRFFV